MNRLATLFCAVLVGCASPGDDGSASAPSAAEPPAAGTADGRRVSGGLDPDAAHAVQVETNRRLRAEQGRADAGGWTIRYRIANPTESPVYLVGCNDPPRPQLQKWLGGAWTPVHDVVDDACRSPAWSIRSGETLPAAPEWSEVRVTYEPGRHPGTEGDTTRRGTYRLATVLFTDDPDLDLASAAQIVGTSRAFGID